MILAVDSSALALLINPGAKPPQDPETGKPIEHCRERVLGLIQTLTPSDTLIVPTPVLAEVLVRAGEGGPAVLQELQSQGRVRISPFDQIAAVELAVMTQEALAKGDKKSGSTQPWQKVKFDRQIIATARVAGATKLYTDDANLKRFAAIVGLDTISTWELPVPEGIENLFTLAGLPADGGANG